MHEASIALGILDIALRECRKAGFRKVQSIGVKIGGASGVMPEALVFAFDAAKLDTPACDAVLIIDRVKVGGACRGCGRDFTTDEVYVFSCPGCGSGDIRINSGGEMDITEIEVI